MLETTPRDQGPGPQPGAAADARAVRRGTGLKAFLAKPEVSVGIALIGLCVAMCFASPYFLTLRNVLNVLRQFSLIAILAVGEALIIITGGIDLSVGSLVGFTACVGARRRGRGARPGHDPAGDPRLGHPGRLRQRLAGDAGGHRPLHRHAGHDEHRPGFLAC